MIDFEHEGLYITEKGYFVSKWNSDTRKYNAYYLKDDEIPFHLNEQVFITENIRLKHIFQPLLELPVFEIIFHSDWWEEIVKELKTKEWKPWIGDTKLKKDIDGDEIEYVEIYNIFKFSQKENRFYSSSLWNFHGIGYPFIDSNNAQSSYLKVGDRQSYALEFSSMADFMNTPFKIGSVTLYNEDEDDYKKRKLIDSADNSITLYELIRAVVYEMSFCGIGDSREDFKENLNSSYEEYKEDPSQSVSYSTTNLTDLLEDLKLQGQEEQAEKTIKKLEIIFNEIENEELLEKMKNLLFTSIKK
jgi:hypothetical protein